MNKAPYYWVLSPLSGDPILVFKEFDGSGSVRVESYVQGNSSLVYYTVRSELFYKLEDAMDYAEQIGDEIVRQKQARLNRQVEMASKLTKRNLQLEGE